MIETQMCSTALCWYLSLPFLTGHRPTVTQSAPCHNDSPMSWVSSRFQMEEMTAEKEGLRPWPGGNPLAWHGEHTELRGTRQLPAVVWLLLHPSKQPGYGESSTLPPSFIRIELSPFCRALHILKHLEPKLCTYSKNIAKLSVELPWQSHRSDSVQLPSNHIFCQHICA